MEQIDDQEIEGTALRRQSSRSHALQGFAPVDAGLHAFDELGSPVDADGTGAALGRCDASLWIIQTRVNLEGAGVGPPSLESGQGACEKTPLTIRKTRSDEGEGDYPPSSCMSQGAGKESPLAVHTLESQGAGKGSPLAVHMLESRGAGKESPLDMRTLESREGAGDTPPSSSTTPGAGSESPLDIQMSEDCEGSGADPPSPSRVLREHGKPRLSDVKAVGPVLPPKDVG